EDQRGAGRDDAAGAAFAVPQVRRNDELPLAADSHRADALVPAADHATAADGEHEGLPAVARAVDLGAVLQPPGVVDAHRVSDRWPRALPFHQVDVAETRCGLNRLFIHGIPPIRRSTDRPPPA